MLINLSLSDATEKAGVSTAYLSTLFSQHMGCGFVASLTEAAGYTFFTMSEESKEKFLEDPDDRELKSFSLKRDEKYILPFYHAVTRKRGEALSVMLSPWSPPPFMKTNGEKDHGGRLKKEYYEMWAEYFCKYIEEYRKNKVDVKIISIQNEPNAVQTWDSCCYNGAEEREFAAIVSKNKKVCE